MATCSQCGFENKPGSSFCVKCGNPMEAAVQPQQPAEQAGAPPEGAGAAPPPAQPPPPQQPAAAPPQAPPPPAQQQPTPPPQAAAPITPPTQPPVSQPGAYTQPQSYTAPPTTYPMATAAYAAPAAKTRGGLFWTGSLLVLVSGVVVLICTWLAWGTGPGGILSLSGWDWYDIGRSGIAGSGEVSNAFFIYSQGYPIFTGLCSLILGGLIALIGGLMLIFRSKGLGGMAILFSIFALGIAITNLTTVVRTEGISIGIGMYLFLVFSFLGLVGGAIAMSD